MDQRQFRDALGAFTTGICVVTTRTAGGADIGLTANSFNSVSLDPPMILWSLANTSSSAPAFHAAQHFGIHVLASNQDHVSAQFAKKGIDRFQGIAFRRSDTGIPLLEDCAAWFECRSVHKYTGGDHTIFVGEVISFYRNDRRPLVFYGGRYATVVGHEEGVGC